MFVVDTNLLIYAAMFDAPQHERARFWLAACAGGSRRWMATWSNLYEFLRVTTHRGIYPHPLSFDQAHKFLEEVRRSPSFAILVETDRHPEVLDDLVREHPALTGNIMHDLHTVTLMREHGVREIHTADKDFLRFRELRVVNPLAA
ncbi:hypothetical protein tb265_41640 [Gemmatimonadetes bacterium T265]|nr:hypothetical protein tb265_41640 [Gemmatimonadetes bacterium T265]